MPTIRVSVNESEIADLQAQLARIPDDIPRVLTAAVNKTAQWVRTRVVRAITRTINIKRGDIVGGAHRFGGVTVRRAARGETRADVVVTGRRIPVYRFGAKDHAPARGRPRRRGGKGGVSYRILKGGGRKRIPSAFITHVASGHVGVFARTGPQRYPIREMLGPSIPHVAERSPELKSALEIDATDQLLRNIRSQIDRMLAKV